jgi:hypothetical protein
VCKMNKPVDLIFDRARLLQRLRARPAKMELFALGMTLCLSVYFVFLAHQGEYFPYDYLNYRNAALGDPSSVPAWPCLPHLSGSRLIYINECL